MSPVAELATAAVTALVPYLSMGAGSLAKKLGTTAAERLTGVYDKVKVRLDKPGKDALTDLETTPGDADAQGQLRLQLKKQLAGDPALQGALIELVDALRSPEATPVLQVATIVGDHDTSIQISGSGNQVSGVGKP